MKTCSTCRVPQPLENFHKNRAQPDGFSYYCKPCWRAFNETRKDNIKSNNAAYYEANKDRCRAQGRRWKAANADKVREYARKERQERPEAVRERTARYIDRHRERLNAKNLQWCKDNRDTQRAMLRRWRTANPAKVRVQRHRRKALKAQAAGTFTYDHFILKCVYHDWRCYLCGTKLALGTVTIDHRKALSQGGSNWPANIAPACGACNSSKGNKPEAEFRKLKGY